MSRSSIGLDIGTRAVRAVEMRGGQVVRFGRVLMPAGAVDHGEVQNPAAVAGAIQTLWKRLKITGKGVHIGMANRRVVVRVIDLPAMSEADLDGAIRLQAQDHIPIPLHEAVMDYEILEQVESAAGHPLQRVLVVAAERSSVDPLLAAVQEARLEPLTLELNAYPLVRSLGDGSGRAEAIVDIGAGVTTVVIHNAGHIRFTRILPNFGGDDFTAAVAEGLNVPAEQAESMKRQASGDIAQRVSEGMHDSPLPMTPSFFENPSLPDEAATAVVTEVSQRTVAELIEPVLQRFVSEVRGSVDFYTSQPKAAPVGRVVLTGGGSLLGGLHDALARELGLQTDVGRPFSRVALGKMNVSNDQSNVAERYLSVAVGLALAGHA
jgi:type IV pilus assembly protein PilM